MKKKGLVLFICALVLLFGVGTVTALSEVRFSWEAEANTTTSYYVDENGNRYLVTAPPECVRYVCLHELAHLKVHGHGADFHALLEKLCPGHRALKRRLDALALRRLP